MSERQHATCGELLRDAVEKPGRMLEAYTCEMSKRVFVCVSGGVVDEVIVPPETNGTWTVINWDNIESDPAREWGQFDEEDRAYVKANYPDDYGKYFAAFESK
jgi:hypothetical protein